LSKVETSVVVPFRGDEKPLVRCLTALNGQTLRRCLEIVVSVDGPEPLSDTTAALADVVLAGPRGGPAAARNRGWKGSAGAFVLFTDSDCAPEPDWAAAMVQALKEGADGVKGIYSKGGKRLIQRLAQVEFRERYRILASAKKVDMVDTYSAGFRREALEKSGGFDESFPVPDHEDVDLSYRLESMGFKLAFTEDARVAHIHRDSWPAYFRMKHSRGRYRFRVLRSFPRKAGSDSYTPRCLKFQILLTLLLPPAMAALPITPLPLMLWTLLFILCCMPLFRVALRRDAAVAPFVFPFALWRALALTSGLLAGIFQLRREKE